MPRVSMAFSTQPSAAGTATARIGEQPRDSTDSIRFGAQATATQSRPPVGWMQGDNVCGGGHWEFGFQRGAKIRRAKFNITPCRYPDNMTYQDTIDLFYLYCYDYLIDHQELC